MPSLMALDGLAKLHKAGELQFFGAHAELADPVVFGAFVQPLRKIDWVVSDKEALAGP